MAKRKLGGSKKPPTNNSRPSDIFFKTPEVKTQLPSTFQTKNVTPLDRKKTTSQKQRFIDTTKKALIAGSDEVAVQYGLNKVDKKISKRHPNKSGVVDTMYDVYNVVDKATQMDPVGVVSNMIGATLPGISGPVIESVLETYINEYTPQLNPSDTTRKEISIGVQSAVNPTVRKQMVSKYGDNWVQNPKFREHYGVDDDSVKLPSTRDRLENLLGTDVGGYVERALQKTGEIDEELQESTILSILNAGYNLFGSKEDKYLTGGYIGNNYMDNPSEVLMENHRNRAQAEYEAHNSLLPQILDTAAPIVGSLASSWSAGQQAKFANWVPNTGERMANNLTQGYQHQPLPGIEMPEIPGIPSFATGGVIDWDTATSMYQQDPPVKEVKPSLETGEVGTGNVPFGYGTDLGEGANLIGKGFQRNMRDVFIDPSNKKLVKQYQEFYAKNPNCLGSAMDCNQKLARHLGLKSLRTIKANHGNEERYRIADKTRFETEYKDNGSTDSWEYYNYMLGEGLATSMLDKSQPLKYKRGSHFPEGVDLYSIPLGAVIGQGNSKGTYTEGDGTRHSWTVVGFDKKDKMPLVFDNGVLRRIDDFSKAVLSHAKHKVNEIIVPNEYKGLTADYFENNISQREKDLGFGIPAKIDTEYPSVKSIEKGANRYKDDIAFEYSIPKDEMDLLIQTLPALAYQETKINNFAGMSSSIGVDSTFGNAYVKPFAKRLKNHATLMTNELKEGEALQPYEMEIMAYSKFPDKDSVEFQEEYKRLEKENEGKKKPIDKNTDKSSRGPFSIKDLSDFAKNKLLIQDRDLNNAFSRKSELEYGAGAALDHLASTYATMKRAHPDYTPEQLRNLAIVGYNNNSKIKDRDFKEHYIENDFLDDDYLSKVLGYSEQIARGDLSEAEIRKAFKENSKKNRKNMRENRATGGFTGGRQVEVEGQEMFELPTGETGKFVGPSHENGGIDVTLPKGTEVYSKRIKGPDGKSMAKRKEERDKILAKIEKDYKKNPLDKLLGQTYNRTKQALEIADQLDLATMEQARQEEAGREQMAQQQMASLDEPMFATGGFVEEDPDEGLLGETLITGGNKLQQPGIWGGSIPIEIPDIPGIPASTIQAPIENTKEPFKFPNIGKLPLPNLTSGDILGIVGNVVKANRAHKDTLSEIATSLPNVNSFDGFGQDALQTLQGNAGLLQQMYDLSTQQLRGRTNANMAQSRGSARGVNQMRAMDLANIQAENQAQAQLDTAHAGQVITNNNAIAQQQNLIDQAEMRGDAVKRLADQQDHGQDHMNLQQTRQAMVDATLGQAGQVLNKSRERDLMSKLISARFDNFETDEFGNIVAIPDQAPMSLEQELEARGLTKEYNTRVARGEDVELRNGKLYKKGTNEVIAEGDKTELEKRIDERNYAGHYERGLGLEGISEGLRFSPGEIKAPNKFYSGVKMKDVEGYLQAHSSEFGNIDLSTEQGVAQLQQQIGAPVDGKFGKDTEKALEKRYKDAKTSGGYQAGLSKKEYQDLEHFLINSSPVIDSIFDKAREIYGDFSPEDFHRDPELMTEATRAIILGGITHADELYDKYKDSMGDLTKEELRKISLLSPEALVEKDGKLTVDLDRRAPGSNYTLGYKVRGTKHKKRFAKKD